MNKNRVVGIAIVVVIFTIVAGSAPVAYPQQKSLPDRPAELSSTTTQTYVSDFEQAYKWNQEVDGWFNPVTVTIVRTNITQRDDGYQVHLEVGFTERTLQAVGDGFYTVNYFVNRTVTKRAATGGQVRPGPNPQNGIVVA